MESTEETAFPRELPLEGLFSRNGYRPMMALKRLNPKEFFINRGPDDILDRRRALLDASPKEYVYEPQREGDGAAVIQFAESYVPTISARTFRDLGAEWEPDFVLINLLDSRRVLGGCVCFPTGWSLQEKRDQPLSLVHAPVPGLNLRLGAGIEQFLGRLNPGDCYQRSNWSLTSSKQLNQQPQDNIPEIDPNCDAAEAFLRVEWQSLVLIDPTRILFGIRIYQCAFDYIRKNREAARLLADNLRTMPEEMLRYKRLARSKNQLIELLEEESRK
jgi:hypothetical protein